jgi:hypothetical protein
MKIWYAIRKPIGFVVIAGVSYLALVTLHAIPELLARFILGMPL